MSIPRKVLWEIRHTVFLWCRILLWLPRQLRALDSVDRRISPRFVLATRLWVLSAAFFAVLLFKWSPALQSLPQASPVMEAAKMRLLLLNSALSHMSNRHILRRYTPDWGNGCDAVWHKLEALERELRQHLYLDTVGKPDFALWTVGARIIHPVTSPSYMPHTPIFRFPWTPQPVYEMRPPELAIMPETQPGQCWAMKGTSGSLGIKLAKKIRPGSISIYHTPKPLALHNDTAPRDVEVWGVLPSKRSGMDDNNFRISTGLDLSYETRLPFHPEYYFTRFLRLGNFTYDTHALNSTQTFHLSNSSTSITTDRMLFLIQNNWGNKDYTCVYRIRVHAE